MTIGRDGIGTLSAPKKKFAAMKVAIERIGAGEADALPITMGDETERIVKRHPFDERAFLLAARAEDLLPISTIFAPSERRTNVYPEFVPFLPHTISVYTHFLGDPSYVVYWPDTSSEAHRALHRSMAEDGWDPLVPVPIEFVTQDADRTAFQREWFVRLVSFNDTGAEHMLSLIHLG